MAMLIVFPFRETVACFPSVLYWPPTLPHLHILMFFRVSLKRSPHFLQYNIFIVLTSVPDKQSSLKHKCRAIRLAETEGTLHGRCLRRCRSTGKILCSNERRRFVWLPTRKTVSDRDRGR